MEFIRIIVWPKENFKADINVGLDFVAYRAKRFIMKSRPIDDQLSSMTLTAKKEKLTFRYSHIRSISVKTARLKSLGLITLQHHLRYVKFLS